MTTPTVPPTSGVSTGNWFTNLEAYFQLYWNDIVGAVQNFLSQLVPFLDVVQQDLPVLAEDLASFANIITTAFPQAGALTAYITEAEALIAEVEPYIVTVLGVIMSLAEATQIGAAVSTTPITGAQKMSFVLGSLYSAYPTIPESVHRQVIEVSLGKIKSKVKTKKP